MRRPDVYRELPAAVAIPDSEAQVVEILRRCHAARVPVVARGAGTSLSGGAMPDKHGVLLSLAKFKRILAVDPLARTAVVQPGVRNLAITEAAAPLRSLLRARSRRRRSPARSAATSPRTPAAFTA